MLKRAKHIENYGNAVLMYSVASIPRTQFKLYIRGVSHLERASGF